MPRAVLLTAVLSVAAVSIRVLFISERPSEARLDEVNQILASLEVEPET